MIAAILTVLVALLLVAIIASSQLIAIREAVEDTAYTACEDQELLRQAVNCLIDEIRYLQTIERDK